MSASPSSLFHFTPTDFVRGIPVLSISSSGDVRYADGVRQNIEDGMH